MSTGPTLERLATCLTDLACAETAGTTRTWSAPTLGLHGGAVFGGQLLGQAVVIAARTFPGMAVKSVSAHFPRSVPGTGSLQFRVETLHHGARLVASYAQEAMVRVP